MKIERIAVSNEDGAGTVIDVTVRVSRTEQFDSVSIHKIIAAVTEQAASRDPEITKDDRQQEVVGVLQQTNEIFHEMVQPEGRRRRHRNPLETEPAPAEEPAQESPTRRRRRSADGATPATTSAASSPSAPLAEAGQSDANPIRRHRAVADAQSASAASEPANLAPTTAPQDQPTRRRRSAVADAGTSTAAASTSTSNDQPTRRRRSTSANQLAPSVSSANAATASPSDDKITDADLSKACSEAARVLTPKVVMEYLKTFGASQAGALKASDRRKFLDGLKAKKEAA